MGAQEQLSKIAAKRTPQSSSRDLKDHPFSLRTVKKSHQLNRDIDLYEVERDGQHIYEVFLLLFLSVVLNYKFVMEPDLCLFRHRADV